jgi:hypothetical protein
MRDNQHPRLNLLSAIAMMIVLLVSVGQVRDTQAFSGWIVFFERNSADVSPQGIAHLQMFIDSHRAAFDRGCPMGALVLGHVDGAEHAAGRDELSVQRAEAVVDALKRLSMPVQSFRVMGAGFGRPFVPTPSGVPEAQNRYARAYIEFKRAEGELVCTVRGPQMPADWEDYSCHVKLPSGVLCHAESGFIGYAPNTLGR